MVIDAVAAAESFVDTLLSADLDGLADQQLLDVLTRLEAVKCRLAAVDHRLVAAVEERRVAVALCQASTATLLSGLLRISRGEARRRVRAAADLGPRRTLTGERLGPVFEQVAAAATAGLISSEQARVIVAAVDALPAAIAVEHDRDVEATLVEYALEFDPGPLPTLAVKLADVLDPDGSLPSAADHQRRREFSLIKYRDGSARPAGRFSPALTARVEAFLDAAAAPCPSTDGIRDPRSAGQRHHDALDAGLAHLLGCTETPAGSGSAAATLVITMTSAQYESRRGPVLTPHGSPITVDTALELTSDGQLRSLVFDAHGGVLDYGRAKRLVPRGKRSALTARDRGCTFPGCDRPPAWTQAHHIVDYADSGPTSIDNCTLACGFHHREFTHHDWLAVMVNGRPHWIPPTCLDPTRTPRRNRIHDPPLTG